MSSLDQFEGIVPPMVVNGKREPCAICGNDLTRGDVITFYWCDVDYVSKNHGKSIYRLYCSDCDREKIQFPANGVTELLAEADYTEDGVIENVSQRDVSLADDGIPWEPEDMFRLFFGEPISNMMPTGRNVNGGPEDVYDTLARVGIDVKEIVNDNGNMIITKDKVKDMRKSKLGVKES